MSIKLRIIKTLSGENIVYDFNLWDGTQSPITEQKTIDGTEYEGYKSAIQSIQNHVIEFKGALARDPQYANEKYQETITKWIKDVSRMIVERFLPSRETLFARAMMNLEQSAKQTNTVLEIATNDYLIPWWISKSYTANTWQEIWASVFVIGFCPAHLDTETTRPILPTKPRIALISRPSNDLRGAADIEYQLKDNGLSNEIHFLDGKKNTAPNLLKRFGLLKDEIKDIIADNQVLLYYGHFELNEKTPEKSCLEALQDFPAGRKEIDIPAEKISLESLRNLLEGKILFLDACRSIGLPSMAKENFPKSENIISSFYLNNKITCIGTIYPIFDDAAVVYMTHFLNCILNGESLGSSMFEARKNVEKLGFPIFDWAPYILIGDPSVKITNKGD